MEPKRLNKFISDTGFCSRREADRLIEEGRVTVNGKEPDAGTRVTPKDKVRIDDQMLTVREEAPVFLVLNKPSGMSATADMGVRDNVVRAINYPATLQPIGRLDRDDEGVLFLSNDSDLVRKLTKADSQLEKELVVTVNKPFTPEFISKLSEACASFEDGHPKKANVHKESTTRFRIILEPGMNHAVKKVCESLGYTVTYLQRVRIQDVTLTKMQKGHWRALTGGEVNALKETANAKAGKAPVKPKYDGKDGSFKKTFSKDKPAFEKGGTRKSTRPAVAEQPGTGKRIGKSRPAPGPGAAAGKGARGGARGAGKGSSARGGGFKGGPKKGSTSGRSR
ncbi:S4 domain-containing protein [Pontibacter oryzae]|uniref:Pseudouridine synthase n=1 Tax=Pontibacter oryzae TaxID=2304593 RepID=A0A399SIQ7_9BACT|nr:S4 domain-containing protein [Pontibacter oryzae]RIJ42373.1 pseudouridine synthase [Pontibacter oryzae]